MAGPLVVGVDCSTTAAKALVVDARGVTLALGRAPIALANPGPDAWEQHAPDWWSATDQALRHALAALGPAGRARVVALACATQRETFVLADERARPLSPALVWMDDRCRSFVDEAKDAFGDEALHALTGKPPCTTPSFYKLAHALRGRPAAPGTRFFDVHGYLAFALTGRFATSLASADPTGMIDMKARAWADSLVSYAGLDPSALPALVAPGDVIGPLSPLLADAWGLPREVVVVAGAGDGQAAGAGAGILDPGVAYLNLGSALVSGVTGEAYATDRAFRTLYAATGGYFYETDLRGGAITLTWLAERLAPGRPPDDALASFERGARALPAGAEGLLALPYWNGVMNPYWDSNASGVFLGLRGHHGPAHLYRALVEGLTFEQRLHTEGVEAATGRPVGEFVVMGGGSRSDLWCQIIADITGKRVTRASTPEATALGAAMLAAAGAGLYESPRAAVTAMSAPPSPANGFDPGADRLAYEAFYGIYRGIYPALEGVMRTLAHAATSDAAR